VGGVPGRQSRARPGSRCRRDGPWHCTCKGQPRPKIACRLGRAVDREGSPLPPSEIPSFLGYAHSSPFPPPIALPGAIFRSYSPKYRSHILRGAQNTPRVAGIGLVRVPKISRYRSITGAKAGFGRAPAGDLKETLFWGFGSRRGRRYFTSEGFCVQGHPFTGMGGQGRAAGLPEKRRPLDIRSRVQGM
jgi:hypothetical protein